MIFPQNVETLPHCFPLLTVTLRNNNSFWFLILCMWPWFLFLTSRTLMITSLAPVIQNFTMIGSGVDSFVSIVLTHLSCTLKLMSFSLGTLLNFFVDNVGLLQNPVSSNFPLFLPCVFKYSPALLFTVINLHYLSHFFKILYMSIW